MTEWPPCPYCGEEPKQLGTVSVDWQHSSGRNFTVHGVPAAVCAKCGTPAYRASVMWDLFKAMDAAIESGFEGNVLEYVSSDSANADGDEVQ